MALMEVGTLVRLKSGGPMMTVQTLTPSQAQAMLGGPGGMPPPNDYAICYWFDVDHILQDGTFCCQGLEVVEASHVTGLGGS